ncbi:DUF4097 domain-containing protein [Paenibacillus methanolicus]|uniref:DUF4097 domain-containing protein n=1 Tax=Paenibacillus methanolicus TaxID=582686 RepID=A0A5S5CFZ0_9BACL|nr:DUF4097 domain-containing protein [Paenibacillus methanolicus]TYP78207.1 hypothetical protein BCM02_102784 [Paenibacillus methanolicus]
MALRTNRIVLLLLVAAALAGMIVDIGIGKEEMFEDFGRKLVNEQKTNVYEEANQDATKTIEGELAVQPGAIKNVALSGWNGDMDVKPADGATIQLRYKITITAPSEEAADRKLAKLKVGEASEGDTLTLAATLNGEPVDDGFISLDYELLLPAGLKLIAKNQYGALTVTDTKGDLDVQSDSGMLEIAGVEGEIAADASYSNVFMHDIVGGIDFKNDYSDVNIEGVRGDLRLASDNGVNYIRSVDGSVTGRAELGSVVLSGTGDADISVVAGNVQLAGMRGDARIRPESSDVTVMLDAGAGYALDVSVQDGGIRTRLPLKVERDPQNFGLKRLRGEVGDGARAIAIDGVASDIHLYTRAAEPQKN